ncbi:hypothetical protein GMSM_10750 [Geomonas sp. Red276]
MALASKASAAIVLSFSIRDLLSLPADHVADGPDIMMPGFSLTGWWKARGWDCIGFTRGTQR